MYTVTCAILGHRTAFSVKIDSNEQVSELKEQIRAKAFQTLRSFQAFDLKLYKINTPMPDDLPTYETLIDSIYLRTIGLNEGNELRHPFLKLSTFQDGFQDGFPDGNLHILVEVPAGESFSSRPGRDVALTTPCNDSLIIHYRPVYPSLIVYHSLQSLPYRPTSTSTPSVCFVVLQRLSHGSLIIQFYSPNPQFHSMSCVIAATSFWVVRTRSEEEG